MTESARKSKCGRKRRSTDRRLFNIVKSNRRRTLTDISALYNENTPQKLPKRTIQRRLHRSGIHRRVVKKTITVLKQNRLKRRLFCRSHLHWNDNLDWSRAIFSDETQIVLGKNRRVLVWRKKGGQMKTRLPRDL